MSAFFQETNKSGIKIIILCNFFGHMLKYQENLLASYYVKQGHSVTVITSTFNSIFDSYADKYDKTLPASEFFDNGVKIIRLPFSINILNRIRRFHGSRVCEILNAEQPDFIFSQDIMFNLRECVKYKKTHANCKISMDYHADYSNSAKNWLSLNILHKIIRRIFLYSVLKYIDKIYPVVPAGFVFLHEVYGIPYERMELLPLGADTDKAKEVIAQNRGKQIREKLNIPSDAIVIFTGGKLDPAKKTHLLIEAFIALSDPRLHLIIIGTASEENMPYKEKLEAMAQNNRNIHFTGWLNGEEVYDYMNASDFAVFPASQSVLWQQAIGMGLPLIVGSHKGQDASYLNIYNCLIIMEEKKITVQEIEKNIIKFIDDTALLERMKKAAVKTSNEYLSYDKIVQQTLNF
jgi:glycosyltransferase involved in cell wall biosynthesis